LVAFNFALHILSIIFFYLLNRKYSIIFLKRFLIVSDDQMCQALTRRKNTVGLKFVIFIFVLNYWRNFNILLSFYIFKPFEIFEWFMEV
jgi:hypothetical protein